MKILFYMGQHGPEIPIAEIASGLHLNKTTVYRLGLKLHELGTKAVRARTLRTESRRYLREMAHVCNEAVILAVAGRAQQTAKGFAPETEAFLLDQFFAQMVVVEAGIGGAGQMRDAIPHAPGPPSGRM
jgi:hypothetical protein